MTPEMYKLALNFKIDSYTDLDYTSVNEMKIALANFGPCVMEYYYDNITSTPWIPTYCIGPYMDVISVVGYTKDRFILRNNWGTDWGDDGYCYMPFADYSKYSIGAYYATFKNNNIITKIPKPLNNTSIILSSSIAGIIAAPAMWLLKYMVSVINYLSTLPWALSVINAKWWLFVISYVVIISICLYFWRVTKYNLRDFNSVE